MLKCMNLTKTYINKRAVSDVSIELESGRIYGLLGENGSGKTTWMKMIAGLTKPTRGQIIFNEHPWTYKDKAEIAYMSTEPFFYDFMNVDMVAAYYNDFFMDFDMKRYYELIKRNSMEGKMKVKELSTGMSAKLKVIATLSRSAKLYLLDEPLNGIDYKAREDIVDIVLSACTDDSTIVISTHLIDEIESFVDEAVFMKDGKILRQVNVEEERMETGKSIADVYMEIM